MALHRKSIGPLTLRLLALLALLGCPQIGAATGTWSVISLPQKPGEVLSPGAVAADTAGNLYVADHPDTIGSHRIQKRDAQGNWSVIATQGTAVGQVDLYFYGGLAADGAGNLYVADTGNDRVQEYTPNGGP
jgi:hypothetical protein